MPPEETARTMMLALDVSRLLGHGSLYVLREPDENVVALAHAILREAPLMMVVGDDQGFLVFGLEAPAVPVEFSPTEAARAGACLAAIARVKRPERPTA